MGNQRRREGSYDSSQDRRAVKPENQFRQKGNQNRRAIKSDWLSRQVGKKKVSSQDIKIIQRRIALKAEGQSSKKAFLPSQRGAKIEKKQSKKKFVQGRKVINTEEQP